MQQISNLILGKKWVPDPTKQQCPQILQALSNFL